MVNQFTSSRYKLCCPFLLPFVEAATSCRRNTHNTPQLQSVKSHVLPISHVEVSHIFMVWSLDDTYIIQQTLLQPHRLHHHWLLNPLPQLCLWHHSIYACPCRNGVLRFGFFSVGLLP